MHRQLQLDRRLASDGQLMLGTGGLLKQGTLLERFEGGMTATCVAMLTHIVVEVDVMGWLGVIVGQCGRLFLVSETLFLQLFNLAHVHIIDARL